MRISLKCNQLIKLKNIFQKITFKASLGLSTGLAFLLLACLFIQSKGMVEGGQDSYNHFLISKYAFKYPKLLIDQWGKPVYTVLAHPLCALGLSYAVWFNIACSLLAGVFCALTSKKLGSPIAVAAFWVCVFAPIALGNSISSLTEPLNMFALSAAFYCWIADHRKISIVLFSLMPWIRTEGFVIIVPILVFLIIKKHYKLIPWLLITTFILNLLGWYMTGKPLWFITENPYFLVETEAERFAPEGGSFLYYLQNNKNVFGNIFLPLSALGAVYLAYAYVIQKKTQYAYVFWVILGVFVAYFFAHSFIMWKGMMGTHGMLRVMMVICPSLAIAFSFSLSFFVKIIRLQYLQISTAILVFISVFSSYKANGYPTKFWQLKKDAVQQIKIMDEIKLAHSYIVDQKLDTAVIYHQLPIYNVIYNKDPFPKPLSKEWQTEAIWSIDIVNNWAPKGSILLWDSYHATREGNIPKSKLKELKEYKELKRFGDSNEDPILILYYKIR